MLNGALIAIHCITGQIELYFIQPHRYVLMQLRKMHTVLLKEQSFVYKVFKYSLGAIKQTIKISPGGCAIFTMAVL